MSGRLELHVPAFEELWYRERLMSDPATMSYNAGYDLASERYHRDTGCMDFPREAWAGWYARFVGQEPVRYYAYLRRREDGAWIGEVNVHENGAGEGCYDMGIVIEARYRGLGYAAEGLRLLTDHAFGKLCAKSVRNSFETERVAAVKAHLTAGFVEKSAQKGVIELEMTREKWEKNRMERMIGNMIAWAEARLGDSSYAGWCLSFVEEALEQSNGIEVFGGDSAKESAEMYADGMRQGEPERGAFVFWDCLCPSEDGPVNWGHCGIALGDGRVIHAWDAVRVDDIGDIEKLTSLCGDHPKYIGWVPVTRVLAQKSDRE